MYALERVLEEVQQRRGPLPGAKHGADYRTVWDTFNRYITTVVEKRLTLNVPTFCKIGWRIEERRNGTARLRPHFQLAEAFVEAYTADIKALPSLPDKQFSTIEEFNLSTAAIKHSRCLTKDNILAGLRAIVQQIGSIVASGLSAKIEFEVGHLLIREHEVKFAFAEEFYLMEGLEVPLESKDVNYQPSVTFAPPTQDALTLRIDGKTKASGGTPNDNLSPKQVSFRSLNATGDSQAQPMTAKEHVVQAAMDRHLAQLHKEAAAVTLDKEQWEEHLRRSESDHDHCEEQRRTLAREHADELRVQIRRAEEKRAAAQAEQIIQSSGHDHRSFTEALGEDPVTMEDGYAYIRERKKNFRRDLDYQVAEKQHLKQAVDAREMAEEVANANFAIKELAKQKRDSDAQKERERAVLTQSWNSDVRVKTARKVIDKHPTVPASKAQLENVMSALPERLGTGASANSSLAFSAPEQPTSARRPPTGMVRRMPLGAAASLALHREKLGSTLRR